MCFSGKISSYFCNGKAAFCDPGEKHTPVCNRRPRMEPEKNGKSFSAVSDVFRPRQCRKKLSTKPQQMLPFLQKQHCCHRMRVPGFRLPSGTPTYQTDGAPAPLQPHTKQASLPPRRTLFHPFFCPFFRFFRRSLITALISAPAVGSTILESRDTLRSLPAPRQNQSTRPPGIPRRSDPRSTFSAPRSGGFP